MKSSGKMSANIPFQKKFARRQEDFQCMYCDSFIQGNGYTNHCPNCLFSKHVDMNPGDRASTCQGMMKPKAKGLNKKGMYILHHCEKCGHTQPNKISSKDNPERIENLSFESPF